jgi:hypothetical protein
MMRAPDSKKPGQRRLPCVYELPPDPTDDQIRKALTVLDPPPAEQDGWRNKIDQAIAFRAMHWNDNVEFDARRSRGRPSNTPARDAVELARRVLETCDLELTTTRKGQWHHLSQIFADTSRDLRHHLDASLADSPLAEKS